MPTPIRIGLPELAYRATVTPAGVRYVIDMDWNLRLGDWRATVSRGSDGVVLCADRRLSPGMPLFSCPEGVYVVEGRDPYEQTDLLDGRLRVLFWSAEELANVAVNLPADPLPDLV